MNLAKELNSRIQSKPMLVTLLILVFLGWAIPNALELKKVHVARHIKEGDQNSQAELEIRHGIEHAGGFDNLSRMSRNELNSALQDAASGKQLRFSRSYIALTGINGKQYICFYYTGGLRFAIDESLNRINRHELFKMGINDDCDPLK